MTLAALGAALADSSATPHAARVRPAASVATRGLDLYRPTPDDNPATSAKVALGRRLFFDRRLSKDSSMACAGCHDPRRAFTDGRQVPTNSVGAIGRRNVPTIVNRVYGKAFFWDGRAPSLEAQVLEPIRNELGSDVSRAVERLSRERSYRRGFRDVFDRDINETDLARAVATYVRSVTSGDSPFDRFMDREPDALDQQAQRGHRIFMGKGNCWLCHQGPSFSDEKFHNTGVAWDGQRFLDEGRGAITGTPPDRGAFKTPTLREVSRTAPYMHDGSFKTLEQVVDFYDAGGRPNPHLDPDISRLGLGADEKRALVAFLHALSGTVREGVW